MAPSVPYFAATFVRQVLPSHADFTEKELPNQEGRVVLVTGASSGMGFELAKILYSKGATVYLAARSQEKLDAAFKRIKDSVPNSRGRLEILILDLADLTSIKRSAENFLGRERILNVLVHNAGVMTPPANSRTKQNYDLEMGTNALGPYLFTQFLLPILLSTTASLRSSGLPPDQAASRIVWTSSIAIFGAPPGGMIWDTASAENTKPANGSSTSRYPGPTIMTDKQRNYCQSKVANVFQAVEVARRYGSQGLISVSLDPGLLKTELQRYHTPTQKMLGKAVFKDPIYGGYTELFAGFSPEITLEKNGCFIIPWGKFGCLPTNVQKGVDGSDAARFWDWCEQETGMYR